LLHIYSRQRGKTTFPTMTLTNSLIVIRHGEDLNEGWVNKSDPDNSQLANWKITAPEWPDYQVKHTVVDEKGNVASTASSLTVFQHGLSDVPQENKDGTKKEFAGEIQAKCLGVNLAKCLEDNGYAKVTKVVTKNPSVKNPNQKEPTPNPFDTVYPFINGDFKDAGSNKVLLINPDNSNLIDPGLASMIGKDESDAGSLYNFNGGSTLLCWDAEGLWGEKVKKKRPYDHSSILGKISEKYLNSSYSLEHEAAPAKGKTVYCFEESKVTIYSFNGNALSKIKTIPRKQP
jgi:hypothetical protein